MHKVNRQAIVLHSAKQMFDLVNNVDEYKEFLKWCYDSSVIEVKGNTMLAEMTVSLVGIKQKFMTKNLMQETDINAVINLELVEGPFEALNGEWKFTSLNARASKIELMLEFNFKSGILNTAFKRAFGKIAQQLVSDFVHRANHVYS